MNDDLKEYIAIRRNVINQLLNAGQIPGVLDSIEINKLHGVLEEFDFMEHWFDE